MKCVKCGFEYAEGRNCPRCGEPSILINEDYYRRKQEWEAQNAARQEEQKQRKKSRISAVLLKRIGLGCAVFLAVLFLGIRLFAAIREWIRVNDNDVIMDVDVYELVTTCDGAYGYHPAEFFGDVSMEMRQLNCSIDGKVAAGTAYDDDRGLYCLYVSRNGESRLALESAQEIVLRWVNCDGSVLVQLNSYGEYGILQESEYVEVDSQVRYLSEDISLLVDTGLDRCYCYVAAGNIYVFEDGKSILKGHIDDILTTDRVIYALDMLFYRRNGTLYRQDGSVVADKVSMAVRVCGTNELCYAVGDKLFFLDAGERQYEFDIKGDLRLSQDMMLRKGNYLYSVENGQMIRFNIRSGNYTLLKDNFNVYLQK